MDDIIYFDFSQVTLTIIWLFSLYIISRQTTLWARCTFVLWYKDVLATFSVVVNFDASVQYNVAHTSFGVRLSIRLTQIAFS